MADTLIAPDVVQLSTSFTTIYTVPALTTFAVSMVHIHNTSGSSVSVQVCLVPSAGAAGVANALLWNFGLTGLDFVEFTKGDYWAAGSILRALASTGSVINIKIAGIEHT